MMTNLQGKRKPIKVLIMSVGEYSGNSTAQYLRKIGGAEHTVVCLPKQYEKNADTYRRVGIDVYVYDEQKYINDKFEYLGFTPRNCGGIGRQGIAEAVDVFGDDYLSYQLDDDYVGIYVRDNRTHKNMRITTWHNMEMMIYCFDDFYRTTGIECAAKTGATIPGDKIVSSRKIFNNFVMRKGVRLNYDGFAALCSDDQRYNIMRNLIDGVAFVSVDNFSVVFKQSQGDRNDGNAILYNSDCSWKKSFALRMLIPWAVSQRVANHLNRALFLENIKYSRLYPDVMLANSNGNITDKMSN